MGIGRKVRLLTDESRKDYYSGEPSRRIPISLFYPTRQEGTSFYADLYDPHQELLEKIYGAGRADRIEHLKSVRTSFLNDAAPDIKKRCPVIVFSHGLEADRDFYLFLVEPLVEQGYFVVTTGHLYDTDLTLLPGGETVKMKKGLLDETSKEERQAQIEERGRDLRFVVDFLSKLNDDSEFSGMLDLDRVGLCGHSLGGMTVLKTMPHPLVKAGVLLDAALRLLDVEKELMEDLTLNKPVLNLRRGSITYGDRLRYLIEKSRDKDSARFRESILREHDEVLEEEVVTRQLYRYAGAKPQYFIYIDKTIHMTFCDWFRLVPDKYYPTLLPIEDAHHIIAGLVSAFFKETLLEEGTDYTDLLQSGALPGVHMEPVQLI